MSNEVVFANGIIFKMPRQGAPDFVKGSLSFKVDEAIQFLQEHQNNGWCNVDLKVSRQGKPYAELNTWKPNNSYGDSQNVNNHYKPKEDKPNTEDDIPF